jgi:hypothetical protein
MKNERPKQNARFERSAHSFTLSTAVEEPGLKRRYSQPGVRTRLVSPVLVRDRLKRLQQNHKVPAQRPSLHILAVQRHPFVVA